MAADKTLTDVLSLLTKVSSQLNGKISKLEKIVNSKQEDPVDNKNGINQDKQANIIEKLLGSVIKQKEPEQVVEETITQVEIVRFGKDAEKYLDKLIGLNAVKSAPSTSKDEKDDGILSKLMKFLPTIGLVLGGLGGFLASLVGGDFSKILQQIKGGNYLEALKTAGSMIFKTVEPFIQSIPIIGPIYSFAQAYLQMERGNVIPGLEYLIEGFVGLLPLPMTVKAGMIGAVSFIGAIVNKRFPEAKLPPGKGGDILPLAFKAIGKMLKIGLFKRLPLIGSAINFYEAYTAFQAGGPAGIAKGLINLGSGIANLFPGPGMAISMGLDILSGLIFSEEETTDPATGQTTKSVKMSDFFYKAIEYIEKIPILNTLVYLGKGIHDIANGNIKDGLVNLAYAIPGIKPIVDLIGMGVDIVEPAVTSSTGVKSFFKILGKNILIAYIKSIPNKFGMRAGVARFLGVSLNEVNATEEDSKIPDNLNVNTNNQSKKNTTGSNNNSEQELLSTDNNEDYTAQLNQLPAGVPTDLTAETPTSPNIKMEEILNNHSKISNQNNKILENLSNAQGSLLSKQLEVMNKHTSLLTEIKNKLTESGNNIISSPTIVSNNFTGGISLRGLQGVS